MCIILMQIGVVFKNILNITDLLAYKYAFLVTFIHFHMYKKHNKNIGEINPS